MRVICVLLLCVIAACSGGESEWTEQRLGTDATFRDILFTDALNGWIVGGRYGIPGGVIGRTFDGGQSWRFRSGIVPLRRSQSVLYFNAIHFVDDQRGVMVGSGGLIVYTSDGGETWRRVRRGPIYSRLYDVDFIDDQRGWAVGWDNVLATDDGGHRWKARSEKRLDGHAIDFVDENNGWIAGPNGDLYRSRDGGETWQAIEGLDLRGERRHLVDVTFVDKSHGWVVGHAGNILHTSDAGETWIAQESGVDAILTAVSFVDSREGWVVGFKRDKGESYVLHTTDGGVTWSIQARVAGEELLAIHTTRTAGWAVGASKHVEPQKILRFNNRSAPAMDANLSE